MAATFDWDDDNVGHIGEHGVEPEEAEDALLDPRRLSTAARRVTGERRFAAIGATEEGRILLVVFTVRHGMVRVVTAHDASSRDKRRYRRRR